MLRRLAPSLLVAFAFTVAHAQFTDDFTDGDFTANPAWDGSTGVFIVNAAHQLQLNDAVAATSQLRSTNAMASLDNTEWRVHVKLTFAPSSSNFGRVYLVSDQTDLSGPLNGYYLQFGEAGSSDAIELFEQTGSTSTSVCRGTEAQIAAAFEVGVQVKRDASGNWQLAVDASGGTNYTLEANGTSTTHTTSTTIGVLCTYTVSNATKFYFDDFYAGAQIVDTEAPTLLSAAAVGPADIDLQFSEAVEQTSAETEANYALAPAITVSSAIRDGIDPSVVHLSLASTLTNGTDYLVTATGVQDLAGNVGGATSAGFTYIVPSVAGPGDVIINEIMADPTPVVGLPDQEFVELYNTTADQIFDLTGWTFSDGGTPGTLTGVTLGPGQYLLLTSSANAPLFTTYGAVASPSSFPSLNNDGDPLELRNAGGTLIDAVSYALSWYNDGTKALGGWALERIDPTAPCSGASNWTASIAAAGGTPDAQNSVYAIVPDHTAPALVNAFVNSSTELELVFSEAMDQASLASGTYTITPTIPVSAVTVVPPDHVRLTLGSALVLGQVYTVTVAGVTDCPGNAIGTQHSIVVALPEAVADGDVVINEVLYDPRGTGSDFVELYNRSSKVLSVAGWKLANVYNGAIDNATVITDVSYILMPGAYVAIAEDTANIAAEYPLGHRDRYLEADMPSYNNGEGTVVLLAPDGDTLDLFHYNDDLHFELLNETEGVSLERVDPDRPTADNSNWHSAAEAVGWATPGYENSQYAPAVHAGGELTIEPAIFSPDNDGYQDLLTIAYTFKEPGFVGTMKVFDVAGREVRTLMDNALLGTSGAVSWDGIMDTKDLARIGPYVVYFEAYDLSGNVEKFRETVVLAHRL